MVPDVNLNIDRRGFAGPISRGREMPRGEGYGSGIDIGALIREAMAMRQAITQAQIRAINEQIRGDRAGRNRARQLDLEDRNDARWRREKAEQEIAARFDRKPDIDYGGAAAALLGQNRAYREPFDTDRLATWLRFIGPEAAHRGLMSAGAQFGGAVVSPEGPEGNGGSGPGGSPYSFAQGRSLAEGGSRYGAGKGLRASDTDRYQPRDYVKAVEDYSNVSPLMGVRDAGGGEFSNEYQDYIRSLGTLEGYAKGSLPGTIPETGPAKLHEGEVVLSKDQVDPPLLKMLVRDKMKKLMTGQMDGKGTGPGMKSYAYGSLPSYSGGAYGRSSTSGRSSSPSAWQSSVRSGPMSRMFNPESSVMGSKLRGMTSAGPLGHMFVGGGDAAKTLSSGGGMMSSPLPMRSHDLQVPVAGERNAPVAPVNPMTRSGPDFFGLRTPGMGGLRTPATPPASPPPPMEPRVAPTSGAPSGGGGGDIFPEGYEPSGSYLSNGSPVAGPSGRINIPDLFARENYSPGELSDYDARLNRYIATARNYGFDRARREWRTGTLPSYDVGTLTNRELETPNLSGARSGGSSTWDMALNSAPAAEPVTPGTTAPPPTGTTPPPTTPPAGGGGGTIARPTKPWWWLRMRGKTEGFNPFAKGPQGQQWDKIGNGVIAPNVLKANKGGLAVGKITRDMIPGATPATPTPPATPGPQGSAPIQPSTNPQGVDYGPSTGIMGQNFQTPTPQKTYEHGSLGSRGKGLRDLLSMEVSPRKRKKSYQEGGLEDMLGALSPQEREELFGFIRRGGNELGARMTTGQLDVKPGSPMISEGSELRLKKPVRSFGNIDLEDTDFTTPFNVDEGIELAEDPISLETSPDTIRPDSRMVRSGENFGKRVASRSATGSFGVRPMGPGAKALGTGEAKMVLYKMAKSPGGREEIEAFAKSTKNKKLKLMAYGILAAGGALGIGSALSRSGKAESDILPPPPEEEDPIAAISEGGERRGLSKDLGGMMGPPAPEGEMGGEGEGFLDSWNPSRPFLEAGKMFLDDPSARTAGEGIRHAAGGTAEQLFGGMGDFFGGLFNTEEGEAEAPSEVPGGEEVDFSIPPRRDYADEILQETMKEAKKAREDEERGPPTRGEAAPSFEEVRLRSAADRLWEHLENNINKMSPQEYQVYFQKANRLDQLADRIDKRKAMKQDRIAGIRDEAEKSLALARNARMEGLFRQQQLEDERNRNEQVNLRELIERLEQRLAGTEEGEDDYNSYMGLLTKAYKEQWAAQGIEVNGTPIEEVPEEQLRQHVEEQYRILREGADSGGLF